MSEAIFAALCVAFAALAVWLTVRIVNRRARWAKRTLVALIGTPVLYVASFGPACWLASRTESADKFVDDAYRPILWVMDKLPRPLVLAIEAYVDLGSGDRVFILKCPDGRHILIERRNS